MDKQTFIRRKAAQRQIKWTVHGLKELAYEPLFVRDVEEALRQADVIEDYPHAHRFLPDCLALAFDDSGQPIHCVVAVNESRDYILIVTVYRPTNEEWENDWRTRK